MSWIRNRDKERTALIEQDVLERGIDSRLILLFDERGVVLKDGHHRVDIAVRQGIEFLPIYFKPIGKIRKEVVPWVDFLELIGQAYLDVVH